MNTISGQYFWRDVRRKPARRSVLCVCSTVIAIVITACAVQAEEKPTPTVQSIKMNFKDTPLETILEQLSEMTGMIVIKDVTVEGRFTIISKQSMSVDEAIALLNSVLKEKGYVGIRTGKILKLVKLDEAKKRNIPVRTGSDPDQIEPNDEVITQVIPIKYIDALQLKRDFAPLIPSYADLSANAASNSLIITDTGANIHRIAKIIKAMDSSSTTVAEVRVFQLKYANATSAARLVNETFKEDPQQPGQQPGGGQPGWMRRAAQFMSGGGGGGGREGGDRERGGRDQNEQQDQGAQGQRVRKVMASADERTNAVVVSAGPDAMKVVEKVLKDLDSNPAEEQSVFVYRCKNAKAQNLEAVMNSLFGTQGRGLTRSASSQRGSTGAGADVLRSSSSNRLPGSSIAPAAPAPQFFGGAGGGGVRPQSLTGDLAGDVFVVADVDSNALIVMASPKNFDRLKAMLKDLDRAVPQVLIKVLIAEVTHQKNDDIGVEASVLTSGTVSSALTDFGVASATGGLITKIVDDNLQITLRAIEGVGKLDILSRPYILASDNQLSSITVGQEVPFIISSRTTETGQTINTIQYQDIGIILNVTAHINEEGLVIMDVAPEVSSLTGTTVPISENVSAPVFAKRSAQSRVGVKDGQTIVIGGLMEDKKTENIRGVPILGRLPGLGTLFRRRTTDKSKTELLIFLTPHVAHEPGALLPMTEQEKEGLKLVPKAVKKGTYDEHLEGLDRGAVIIPLEELPPEPPPVLPPPPSEK